MPSRLHGKLFNERGFTLIELLIVISIIGVLSVIAIPRFSNAIVLANTAKVQSDLSVINTSITLYQAENGSYPSSIKTDLKDYIVDIDNLKPPKGECLLRTTLMATHTEPIIDEAVQIIARVLHEGAPKM